MNILLPGLEMDTNYAVQVKPSGPDHLKDDWSPIFYFTTVSDTNPPPKPSTPILGASDLGTVKVTWDGNDDDGNSMYDVAPDTAAVEVHVSDTSGFTPGPGTLSGHIMRVGNDGGTWIVSRTVGDTGIVLDYGNIYVKFVAIDTTNKPSPPSDEAIGTIERISGINLEDGTIGPEKVSFELESGAKVTASSTAPTTPNEGDVWIDTANGNKLKRYDGAAWVEYAWGQSAIGPNAIGTAQLQAGAIVAGSAIIADGAITAAKIGTGEIVNAKIANAAIDDAKIANMAAGKITAGTLSAAITLSGYIATATSGARAVLNSSGFFLYGSSGQNTVSFNASSGNATIIGNVTATLFRSTGYQTSGWGYIEVGNSGWGDPVDEVRMWYGGRVSSIRNPSSRPGAIIFSSAEFGTSKTITLGYYGLEVQQLQSTTWPGSNYIDMNSSGGIVIKPVNNTYGFNVTKESSGTAGVLLSMTGTGASLKLLSSQQVQARNAGDTAYVSLVASNLAASSSTLKENITPLNINATQSLSQVQLRAWDWKGKDTNDGQVGFLLEDLPEWMYLTEDAFNMSTVVAVCAQAIGELNARVTELEGEKS